jgi:general secretion pathway protein I
MRSREAGFTLIETLVAMMIMTGAIIVVASAWSGNLMRIGKAQINATTATLLVMKMTEFELKYREKSISEIPDEAEGDFGAQTPLYRWKMKSAEFKMPDMSATLSAKDGGADQLLITMVKSITEYINQAVKELTVTVIYKNKAGAELTNSVTTYFVDYSKEIPLGVGGK